MATKLPPSIFAGRCTVVAGYLNQEGAIGRQLGRRLRHRPINKDGLLDEYGFVKPLKELFAVDNLFGHQAALVLAPPWMGKTFVAERLIECLQTSHADESKTFEHFKLTPFEDHRQGTNVFPEWWDEWKESASSACWIIDALDEGERIDTNVCVELLRKIQDLERKTRGRLTLIMFAREAELPPRTIEVLTEIYGHELVLAELMPMDPKNAENHVGIQHFQRVKDMIKRFNLRHISGYPKVLEVLKEYDGAAELKETDIWKMVLRALLTEWNPRRSSACSAEVEDMFDAVSRMAAVMTCCDIHEIKKENRTDFPNLSDLLARSDETGRPFRNAAREAFTTGMFRPTATGHRFPQKHVQEWMCAFGLKTFSWNQLRPLLEDEQGKPVHHLQNTYGLLRNVTTHEEVREGICELYGGVPPLSDATPLSLEEARRFLNRLEELARSSPWPLSMWRDIRLQYLAVRGIGEELSRRLADKNRPASVKEVLLDIAGITRSHQTLPVLEAIIRNTRQDSHLRRSAVSVFNLLADDDELEAMAGLVRSARPREAGSKAVVAALICEFLERKLWSVPEAFRHAPVPEGAVLDSTHVLNHTIEKDMSLEHARELLHDGSLFKSVKRKSRERAATTRRDRDWPLRDVEAKAIKLILAQTPAAEDDLEALLPLAKKADSLPFAFFGPFRAAYGQSQEFRRKLYLSDVNRAVSGWWRSILTTDDLEWLFERAPKLAGTDETVWGDVLAYKAHSPKTLKLRIGRYFNEHMSEKLKEYNRQRKNAANRLRRLERKERQYREEAKAREVAIGDIVEDALNATNVPLIGKMHRLTWVCFEEDSWRPTNVVGSWEDLPSAIRESVLDLCLKALHECQPTEIPEGKTWPASISHEAKCFEIVLKERNLAFVLDGEQIERWLPSVLRHGDYNRWRIVEICYRSEQQATETVLIDAIGREGRAGSSYLVSSVPEEYWSQDFAERIATLIAGNDYDLDVRANLLRTLGQRNADVALPLAKSIYADTLESKTTDSSVAASALDVLLALKPERGWLHIREEFDKRGKDALTASRFLTGGLTRQISPDFKKWPAQRLLELARILFAAFAADTKPSYMSGGGFVTPEDHLIDLRSWIVGFLLSRSTSEDIKALRELCKEQPTVDRWYRGQQVRQEQEEVLGSILSPGARTAPENVDEKVKEVVRLLSDAHGRLRVIRNDLDLFYVLREELQNVAADAKSKHLDILYNTDKRRERTKTKHEKALQAYVGCRLADRLPNIVCDRETQITLSAIPDIKVTASKRGEGLAQVIIEIKWSHNQEVATALKEQLGEKYLKNGGFSHGIYLVGWSGELHWRRRANPRPKTAECPDSLAQRLKEQAEEYGQNNPALFIEPIVLDLT